MIEYNERLDQQISDALRRDGRVLSDGLPGLDEGDGAFLLQRYMEIHTAEVPLTFDGRELTWAARPEPSDPVSSGQVTDSGRVAHQSPVDQVLAAPVGRSLLDTAASGPPVNRAFWLLPLSLGVLGGLIAWLVVRDDNPRVARSLFVAGVAIQVVSTCLGLALAPTLNRMTTGAGAPSSARVWTASETGRPTFHYFGTAT